MPIEIRELIVRAQVDPAGERAQQSAPSQTRRPGASEESLTKACVKEVLRILEDKRER